MPSFLSKLLGKKKHADTSDLLDGERYEAVPSEISPSTSTFPENTHTPKSPPHKSKSHGLGLNIRRRAASPPPRPERDSDISAPVVPPSLLSLDLPSSKPEEKRNEELDLGLSNQTLNEEVLRKKRLTPAEALYLVQKTSEIISERGLEVLGVMRPHWFASPNHHEAQLKLLSYFFQSLTIRPVNGAGPSLSSDDPFENELRYTRDPHDVAAVLRWGLRHLQLENDTFASATVQDWYQTFVNSERAEGYPPQAFDQILSPLLPNIHVQLTRAVLDLIASLAAHSEANGISGNKLSKVLGWWIISSRAVKEPEWPSFYADWEGAARQFEHLFLAYLRNLGTHSQMPKRLLELTKDYPFKKYSKSEDGIFLPRTRLSTRTTDALYIRISVQASSDTPSIHPIRIIVDSLNSFPDKDVSGDYLAIWESIREAAKTNEEDNADSSKFNLFAVFADESLRLLSLVPGMNDIPDVSVFPVRTSQRSFSLVERPLSLISNMDQKSTTDKAQSPSMTNLDLDHVTDWQAFSTTGFRSPSGISLSASLWDNDVEVSTPPIKRNGTKHTLSFGSTSEPPLEEPLPTVQPAPTTERVATPVESSTVPITFSSPSLVKLDEAFVDFWADTLRDSVVEFWPAFVVCQLKPMPNLKVKDSTKSIEWIIIERVVAAPVVLPKEAEPEQLLPVLSTPPKADVHKSHGFFSSLTSPSRKRWTLFSSKHETAPAGKERSKGRSGPKAGEMGEILKEEDETPDTPSDASITAPQPPPKELGTAVPEPKEVHKPDDPVSQEQPRTEQLSPIPEEAKVEDLAAADAAKQSVEIASSVPEDPPPIPAKAETEEAGPELPPKSVEPVVHDQVDEVGTGADSRLESDAVIVDENVPLEESAVMVHEPEEETTPGTHDLKPSSETLITSESIPRAAEAPVTARGIVQNETSVPDVTENPVAAEKTPASSGLVEHKEVAPAGLVSAIAGVVASTEAAETLQTDHRSEDLKVDTKSAPHSPVSVAVVEPTPIENLQSSVFSPVAEEPVIQPIKEDDEATAPGAEEVDSGVVESAPQNVENTAEEIASPPMESEAPQPPDSIDAEAVRDGVSVPEETPSSGEKIKILQEDYSEAPPAPSSTTVVAQTPLPEPSESEVTLAEDTGAHVSQGDLPAPGSGNQVPQTEQAEIAAAEPLREILDPSEKVPTVTEAVTTGLPSVEETPAIDEEEFHEKPLTSVETQSAHTSALSEDNKEASQTANVDTIEKDPLLETHLVSEVPALQAVAPITGQTPGVQTSLESDLPITKRTESSSPAIRLDESEQPAMPEEGDKLVSVEEARPAEEETPELATETAPFASVPEDTQIPITAAMVEKDEAFENPSVVDKAPDEGNLPGYTPVIQTDPVINEVYIHDTRSDQLFADAGKDAAAHLPDTASVPKESTPTAIDNVGEPAIDSLEGLQPSVLETTTTDKAPPVGQAGAVSAEEELKEELLLNEEPAVDETSADVNSSTSTSTPIIQKTSVVQVPVVEAATSHDVPIAEVVSVPKVAIADETEVPQTTKANDAAEKTELNLSTEEQSIVDNTLRSEAGFSVDTPVGISSTADDAADMEKASIPKSTEDDVEPGVRETATPKDDPKDDSEVAPSNEFATRAESPIEQTTALGELPIRTPVSIVNSEAPTEPHSTTAEISSNETYAVQPAPEGSAHAQAASSKDSTEAVIPAAEAMTSVENFIETEGDNTSLSTEVPAPMTESLDSAPERDYTATALVPEVSVPKNIGQSLNEKSSEIQEIPALAETGSILESATSSEQTSKEELSVPIQSQIDEVQVTEVPSTSDGSGGRDPNNIIDFVKEDERRSGATALEISQGPQESMPGEGIPSVDMPVSTDTASQIEEGVLQGETDITAQTSVLQDTPTLGSAIVPGSVQTPASQVTESQSEITTEDTSPAPVQSKQADQIIESITETPGETEDSVVQTEADSITSTSFDLGQGVQLESVQEGGPETEQEHALSSIEPATLDTVVDAPAIADVPVSKEGTGQEEPDLTTEGSATSHTQDNQNTPSEIVPEKPFPAIEGQTELIEDLPHDVVQSKHVNLIDESVAEPSKEHEDPSAQTGTKSAIFTSGETARNLQVESVQENGSTQTGSGLLDSVEKTAVEVPEVLHTAEVPFATRTISLDDSPVIAGTSVLDEHTRIEPTEVLHTDSNFVPEGTEAIEVESDAKHAQSAQVVEAGAEAKEINGTNEDVKAVEAEKATQPIQEETAVETQQTPFTDAESTANLANLANLTSVSELEATSTVMENQDNTVLSSSEHPIIPTDDEPLFTEDHVEKRTIDAEASARSEERFEPANEEVNISPAAGGQEIMASISSEPAASSAEVGLSAADEKVEDEGINTTLGHVSGLEAAVASAGRDAVPASSELSAKTPVKDTIGTQPTGVGTLSDEKFESEGEIANVTPAAHVESISEPELINALEAGENTAEPLSKKAEAITADVEPSMVETQATHVKGLPDEKVEPGADEGTANAQHVFETEPVTDPSGLSDEPSVVDGNGKTNGIPVAAQADSVFEPEAVEEAVEEGQDSAQLSSSGVIDVPADAEHSTEVKAEELSEDTIGDEAVHVNSIRGSEHVHNTDKLATPAGEDRPSASLETGVEPPTEAIETQPTNTGASPDEKVKHEFTNAIRSDNIDSVSDSEQVTALPAGDRDAAELPPPEPVAAPAGVEHPLVEDETHATGVGGSLGEKLEPIADKAIGNDSTTASEWVFEDSATSSAANNMTLAPLEASVDQPTENAIDSQPANAGALCGNKAEPREDEITEVTPAVNVEPISELEPVAVVPVVEDRGKEVFWEPTGVEPPPVEEKADTEDLSDQTLEPVATAVSVNSTANPEHISESAPVTTSSEPSVEHPITDHNGETEVISSVLYGKAEPGEGAPEPSLETAPESEPLITPTAEGQDNTELSPPADANIKLVSEPEPALEDRDGAATSAEPVSEPVVASDATEVPVSNEEAERKSLYATSTESAPEPEHWTTPDTKAPPFLDPTVVGSNNEPPPIMNTVEAESSTV